MPPPPSPPSTTTIQQVNTVLAYTTYYTSSAPAPPPPPPSSVPPAPTPLVTSCPTPGVYTIPETTITVVQPVTVCAATTTSCPAGTYTLGGVTTVVETATTVVCPYAQVATNSGVVTSTILTTTYVCPSAGTYTIAPITTIVPTETIVVYPIATIYAPGTYCQPEIVTTITEIDVVVFCPVTPVVAPTPPPVVVTTSAAPVVATPSVAPSSTGSASIEASGNQWAISYTPYTSSGACKSASDVLTDMQAIKSAGFTTVRIYATDCSGLVNVGAGCQAVGLKMILGVFIDSTGISTAQEQVTEIIAWAQWELVVMIVVGNEAVFNGYCTPGALATFISSCKSSFTAAGYTGQVTTTEPLNILQEYTSTFCDVVDIVGCNIHAFFNADVTADGAGSFVAQELEIVNGLCPGKTGVNLETGWPSAGDCNGQACPSPQNQKTAVEGIISACGSNSVIFSFEDDLWKAPGAFNCEQSWGVMPLFSN